MLGLFLPGKRTYILSILAMIMAVLLQADSHGIFTLAPMLRLMIMMILTIIVPMLPIYLRKAIDASQKK